MDDVIYLRFTPRGILQAYSVGVFPMADSETGEIEWYLPDPRAVIPLDGFHISRSLARRIRRGTFGIRFDTDFLGVMRACADRPGGSWISDRFVDVYCALYRAGFAHSVEAWRDGRLMGGAYGVSIGGAFMAESMFHRETDASKVALAALVDHLRDRGYLLLDVQFLTPHLASLGAVWIPLDRYSSVLDAAILVDCSFDSAPPRRP